MEVLSLNRQVGRLHPWLHIGVALIVVLLLVITVSGVLSISTTQSYQVTNQYGETIRIYGAGLYAHDSYFKAPIFIGTDLTMMLLVLPVLIVAWIKNRKRPGIQAEINLFSLLGIILYYAMSISFGVTYNDLHLLYIALFGLSFFLFFCALFHLHSLSLITKKPVCTYSVTKGMNIFLVCSGVALFIAWLPDIMMSWAAGGPLELIEIYTTEITYVIDMGIISPLMFIILYLLHKKSFLGMVLFRMVLRVCSIMGVMLPVQSVVQFMMGIEIAFPVLLTKVLIFVALAVFALYFDFIFKKKLVYL